MQGTLSQIDMRSILHLIELGQKTGVLLLEGNVPQVNHWTEVEVSNPHDRTGIYQTDQSWFLFFLNGQIIYATGAATNLARLKDYLRRYQAEAALTRYMTHSSLEQNACEYDCLWLLLKSHVLTPAQGRKIIHGMVHETLFDLFSLSDGRFFFAADSALMPQLTTLSVTPHLTRTVRQVQQWKQLNPYIQSPEQCPAIATPSRLQTLLSNRTFNKFSEFADGKTSIRQISRYLHRDILTVARAIYPYIQQGVIHLPSLRQKQQHASLMGYGIPSNPAQTNPAIRTPTVVCINDEANVQAMVQSTLKIQGYEVTAIANTLNSFSQIFQLTPDLILCKVEMPGLNGYEICAMLRQVKAFRRTPIIMLVDKGSLIDRVHPKLVGATDYLTKPFGESELLMLVEKYTGPSYLERSKSVTLLADDSDDRLQIDRADVSSVSSTPLN